MKTQEVFPSNYYPFATDIRYSTVPIYTDGSTSFVGLNTNILQVDSTVVQKFVTENKYAFRPDLISYLFYQTPLFGWVLCAYNNIVDPFDPETGLYSGRIIDVPDKNQLNQSIFL